MQYTSVCNRFSRGKARQPWCGARGLNIGMDLDKDLNLRTPMEIK
jgi:hypothetical protein